MDYDCTLFQYDSEKLSVFYMFVNNESTCFIDEIITKCISQKLNHYWFFNLTKTHLKDPQTKFVLYEYNFITHNLSSHIK